jgi:hypothetical protein
MTIVEQLKQQIRAYDGPLPATGNSIEEAWFRGAVAQLYALEGLAIPLAAASRANGAD